MLPEIKLTPKLSRQQRKRLRQQQIQRDRQDLAQIRKDLEIIRELPNQYLARGNAFIEHIRANKQKVKNLLATKFKALQTVNAHFTQQMNDANEEIKYLKESITTNEKKIKVEEKWIKLNKKWLHLQMQEEESEAEYQRQLITKLQDLEILLEIFIEIIDEKQERKERVQEFLKYYTKTNLATKNPKPIVKHANKIQFKNKPEIEFIPESKQLIFRIPTFEGKIIQFILFFEPETKRFGLKNPCKAFQNTDLNAVRAFNIHKNVAQFHTELRLLVVQYVDDADDLPVYEGN